MNISRTPSRWTLAVLFVLCTVHAVADDEQPVKPADTPAAKPKFQPPAGLLRLAKDHDIWLDVKRKRVVVDGVVCLREGQLEMFACPRQTKEHESVVSVNCKAREVHAGLMAVGARPGHPAQFQPKYEPATGTIIDIVILWYDVAGKKQSMPAQQWIRNVKTGKAMKYDWVFAGSGVWNDPDTGENFYHGDAGDFICVSNFPSATLDLPVESSQANSDLLFESFTKHIPAKGTPIRLVLTPRPAKPTEVQAAAADKDKAAADDAKKDDAKKDDAKKDDAKKDDAKKN